MSYYLTLKLLHLIAMIYWLGGDLGTFYSSRFVVDPKLSPAQRHTALKIMLGCDQGPKLCMPLIFALGFSMSTHLGLITVPAFITIGVWIIALVWLANVNYLYFTQNMPAKARLAQIDLWFRVVVVLALLASGVHALAGDSFIKADWLAAKILIFAALVACGIYIRIQLKPFVAAFSSLMTKGSSPEVEQTLSRALARCRPPVYLIWTGLIVNAAFGIHLLNL